MPISPTRLAAYVTGAFIETGTGSGSGVMCALEAGFEEVRSVELSPQRQEQNKLHFSNDPRVKLWSGASHLMLPHMLSGINYPVTFWLDAHYCGPGSAMGEKICPLIEELEVLKLGTIKDNVILIDDVCLIGAPELPEVQLDQVKAKVLEINPQYEMVVVENVLICTPPGFKSKRTKVPKVGPLGTDNIYPYLEAILPQLSNPVFLEVGAADGADTERIIKLNPNARYYAFEPDIRNTVLFKKKGLNVTLVESAVGSYNGRALLYMSSGINPTYGFNHTFSSSIRRPRKHLEVFPWCKFDDLAGVPITKLDTYCENNNIRNIDFLWVDIQGAEPDLIRGARNILPNVAYLYMEYCNENMYEGQYDYDKLIQLVPKQFEVLHRFSGDVLLFNRNKVV